MKNFTGIQLSEPFTFRLYEDCCEMAEYASDNCIKMLPEKTEELSKIVLSEFGEGKKKLHTLYQEIVIQKENILQCNSGLLCRNKKLFIKNNDQENSSETDVNIEKNQDHNKLKLLYEEFNCLISTDYVKKLTEIHSYLSELVSPATAATIIFTKPSVNFPFTKNITTIPFMKNLMKGALIFFAIFVFFFIFTNVPEEYFVKIGNFFSFISNYDYSLKGSLLGDKVANFLVSLSAAALGGYFYSLHTANKYFVKRTFDKKYVTYYNIRIVIGIISGMILANFIKSEDKTLSNIPFVLLAMLGGFSVEAVILIMKKLIGSIIIVFKGNPDDIAETLEQEYKAKTNIEISKFKMERYKELLEFSKVIQSDLSSVEKSAPENKEILDKLKESYNEILINFN